MDKDSGATKGRGLDAWKWGLLPLMAAVILMAYLWAGDAAGFQDPKTARIIFWHVPMAMIALVWFTAAAWYSFRYLRHRLDFDDTKAAEAAGVGLVTTVLATVTGAVFSKMQWAGGANSPWYAGYWQWDPKQTAIVIVIVFFMAYFALRMSIDDPRTRARLSAVYAIIGAVVVPVCYYVLPQLDIFGSQSLHPNNVINTREGMDVPYKTTFWLANLGFLGITLWGYQMRLRLARLEERYLVPQPAAGEERVEAVRKPLTES